jgi:thioesterase domain-containing protein
MTSSLAADNPEAAGASAGARVELLRAGRADEPLFLVPGLAGEPSELAALAAAFVGPQEVYAVAPLPGDGPADLIRFAERMLAAIRQRQPAGPYRLGGYSFGGLAALEMAQQLRAGGEVVEALFLIDALYDERYWQRGIWLRALLRRAGRQLGRIARMRPDKAVGELRLRAGRLAKRVLRRKADATDRLHAVDASMTSQAYAAISGYRPRFYSGAMTLVASSVDRHFGCDTARIWAGLAERIEVARVDGDHLTVMQDAASAAAVARAIDHRLAMARADWPGIRPVPGFARPMILTTMRWFSAARLAHALLEAGFVVSACRPRSHPLELVEGLTSEHRLSRWWRGRSVLAAIRRAEPDIILPDDERALTLLRRLHARVQRGTPELAAVIAHSLGRVDAWPQIASRTGLATAAHALDIPAPLTRVVDSTAALREWVAGQSLPIVLKTDGSWGGRGVAIVRQAAHVREAWRTISNPPGLVRALKRMLFNVEAGPFLAWVRRAHPVVNAQQYVKGREAIATVACAGGAVQALVCLEVVEVSEIKGPAAVVRIVDHPGMAEAARRLVGRFGLTGFCGFDFILTDTGEAALVEMNPRITPTSYLLVEGNYRRSRTIALFPPDLGLGSAVPAVLDVPVRAPALVQRGERMALHRYGTTARLVRRLKQMLIASRY